MERIEGYTINEPQLYILCQDKHIYKLNQRLHTTLISTHTRSNTLSLGYCIGITLLDRDFMFQITLQISLNFDLCVHSLSPTKRQIQRLVIYKVQSMTLYDQLTIACYNTNIQEFAWSKCIENLLLFTVTDAKYIALLNPKTDRCFWFDYYVKVFGVKYF